jgi:hypothetical protein
MAGFAARYDLDTAGQWQPLAGLPLSPAAAARFGKPRFTPEEQAQFPDRPLTRLVKDVLKVGRWKVGASETFDFTAEVLAECVKSHQLLTARGWQVNLCNTHGDQTTGVVHPDDLIAPLDRVVFDESTGTLWASTYVTPAQAAKLRQPTAKTSPRVYRDYRDGANRLYPFALGHVAVVDQPVIPGQFPFIDMANQQGSTMDFAALLELVNQLLPEGVALPEDTDESNLVERLTLILSTLSGAMGEPTEPPAEEPVMGEGELPNDPAPADMDLKQLRSLVMDMSHQLKSLKKADAKQRETAFTDRLKGLAKAGVLDGKGVTAWLGFGSRSGWDLSLLDSIPGAKAIDLSNHAQRHASPHAPATSGSKLRTPEQIAADLAEQGKAAPVKKWHKA